MNIANLFKLKQAKAVFFKNHPKLPDFLDQVKKKGFAENTEIAIAIRYPDGTQYKTGIRVQESDLDLLNSLKNL